MKPSYDKAKTALSLPLPDWKQWISFMVCLAYPVLASPAFAAQFIDAHGGKTTGQIMLAMQPGHGTASTKEINGVAAKMRGQMRSDAKRYRAHRASLKRRNLIHAEQARVSPVSLATRQSAAIKNIAATENAQYGKAEEISVSDINAAKNTLAIRIGNPQTTNQALAAANENSKSPTRQMAQSQPVDESATGSKRTAPKLQGRIGSSSFEPDTSLISVLQDMARAMKTAKVLSKVEGVDQQAVVDDARKILEKALQSPGLASDRIIGLPGKAPALGALKTEAWASGEVQVSEDLRGSLAAVWAKRPNGLINITVAGNSPNERAPNGKRIGQFIVVITGNSSVQTGMDIQSQADVDFWLAEVQHLAVESECFLAEQTAALPENQGSPLLSGDSAGEQDLKKKFSTILGTIVTERDHQHPDAAQASLSERQVTTQTEVKAARIGEFNLKGEELPLVSQLIPSAPVPLGGNKVPTSAEAMSAHELKQNSPEMALKPNSVEPIDGERLITVDDVVLKDGSGADLKAASPVAAKLAGIEQAEVENDAQLALRTLTTTANQADNPHSENEALLLPQRAIAGQPVTVSVLDDHKMGRANVQLNFNGVASTTDESGRAFFTVPEDATPGKTLSVAVPICPDLAPKMVEVLQPLTPSGAQQSPRIDNVPALTASSDVLVIDGHNFDGICQHDRVWIDGVQPVNPVAASPLQLKAFIPKSIGPGKHTVSVFVNEKQSNEVPFQTFAIEIRPSARDTSKSSAHHVKIKIIGTRERVPLRVINQTPAIVLVAKGNDFHTTSPGGESNCVVLSMQRLKKGAFKIDAKLDVSM